MSETVSHHPCTETDKWLTHTLIPAGVNAQAAGGSTPAGDGSTAAAGVMLELLEGTLWQRQLGSLSEEMVAALVCQVRGGRERRTRCVVQLTLMCSGTARMHALSMLTLPRTLGAPTSSKQLPLVNFNP